MASSRESMLLHVCCAPCYAVAAASLRGATAPLPPVSGLFFFNPNIHPLLEFRRRVKALKVYLERDPASAEIDERYGLHEFLDAVGHGGIPRERRERCYRCYRFRLDASARMASRNGVGRFSTTLLASREQDRDLVGLAGREAGRQAGVEFFEADLRAIVPAESMLRGVYRQQYCGCIFSEEERYRQTTKHLYPPLGAESRDTNRYGARPPV